MQPEIVCLGEPMIELNQTSATEPVFLQGYGGDTSNCAVAAARQGGRVGYMSAVGDDSFGHALLGLWRDEGVDASQVRLDRAAPTGIYFVTHGPAGHVFSYRRAGSAASRLTPADTPGDYIAGARVLHLSGISHAISDSACDAAFHAMEIARRHGVLVAYDTNLRLKLWPLARARAIIHAAAAMADILRPGLDDAMQLTGLADPGAIVAFYRALGPRIVVLTLGADGALVAEGDRVEHVPPHRVDAVDATGAGDTFDGAFLAEFVATGDAMRAARYANAAAALATTGYGAVAPMPRRAAVEAFLATA